MNETLSPQAAGEIFATQERAVAPVSAAERIDTLDFIRGLAVMGILAFASPQFYGDVIHEKFIQYGLMGLGGWMFLGNLVMRRMIDMRI